MAQADLKPIDMPFPMKGLHESSSISDQPPETSRNTQNCRGYDLVARRDRGCQRVGLVKYVPDEQDVVPIDMIVVGIIDGSFTPTGPDGGSLYSWDSDTQDVSQNDGGQSFFNILTTNDPRDPMLYLVWDPAFLTSVSTVNLGGGQWQVNWSTVTNAGAPTPSTTLLTASTASITISFPGYVFSAPEITTGTAGQTYKQNGVTKTLPIFMASGDAIQITVPSAFTGQIRGQVLVSDQRMSIPTFVLGSGNGTIGGGFSAISSYTSTLNLTFAENSPFGGTTLNVTCVALGLTFALIFTI